MSLSPFTNQEVYSSSEKAELKDPRTDQKRRLELVEARQKRLEMQQLKPQLPVLKQEKRGIA